MDDYPPPGNAFLKHVTSIFSLRCRPGARTLHHDGNGFVLEGCEGQLHYERSPLESYSVYSDYFWYEIGDVICIGDRDKLFYCFPRQRDVVAKVRMATEEIFNLRHPPKGRDRRRL